MAARRRKLSKRELRRRVIRRRRRVFLVTVILILCLLGFGIYRLFFESPVRSRVRFEAGNGVPSIGLFLKKDNPDATMLTHMGNLDLRKPGNYTVEIQIGTKTYTPTLTVVDTIPPEGTPVDQQAILNTQMDPESFVGNIQDATDVKVSYGKTPDFTRQGTQEVEIVLKDAGGNKTTLTANLTLGPDRTPPVISGTADRYVLTGTKEVDFSEGVTVKDDHDLNVKLIVNSDEVDLNTPGEYAVSFTAADSSGNQTRAAITVYVVDTLPEPKEETAEDGESEENHSEDEVE